MPIPTPSPTRTEVNTTFNYSVSGDDREVLAFDSGILKFMTDHEPDYETKVSYSISVVARSGTGSRRRSTTLDVAIEVVNGEDAGTVSLSQREPQVGREVVATPNDPDGGVRIDRWVWERSAEITVDEGDTLTAECQEGP